MSKHGKVLVAMSGGVDSSVAAAMLREEGYDIVGITMKTWDYAQSGGCSMTKEIGCCSIDSMNDARSVALKMDFPHFVLDIRDEFGDWVIDRFVDDYLSGRTPNPCVLCNTHIKWAALLKRADDLECEFIATGHYARVREDRVTGRFVISRGIDAQKDQSYVLWGLPQDHLKRSLFPLGELTKPRIREMASEYGLDRVAGKRDSYEICFVPDNDYRRFLRKRVPDLDEKIGEGAFVDVHGSEVGRHKGYPYYTIGQRHGLGVALGEPVYVTHIDAGTNTITLGNQDALLDSALIARQINLVKVPAIEAGTEAVGKIRYKDPGAPCKVWQTGPDELRVVFDTPRRAITPGQSLVVYEGDDVLAGGWISRAISN